MKALYMNRILHRILSIFYIAPLFKYNKPAQSVTGEKSALGSRIFPPISSSPYTPLEPVYRI